MKKILKPFAAVALAAALAFSSGCAQDTSWSYKASGTTLSNGNWIYYTYAEYEEALSKIQEEKSNDDTSYTVKDISKEKIEDKKALDWIYAQAKDACISQLTVEKLIKDNKVKVDEDELATMESYYKQFYESYYQDLYTKLGISEESFLKAAVRSNYLSDKLFTALYDEGGSKAVSDEDLKKYFEENYTHYFYISYPLSATDDSGTTTSLSDEEKETAETNFRKYVNMINNQNKTTEDVRSQYQTDFGSEATPQEATIVLDDASSMNDDLKDAIKALGENKAVLKEIDDTLYFVYKAPIADYTSKITKDSEMNEEDSTQIARSNILKSMKNSDYEEYIKAEKEKLKYTKNDACMSKYTIQRTVDIVKAEEEAAAS